jgi:hypothetical protein
VEPVFAPLAGSTPIWLLLSLGELSGAEDECRTRMYGYPDTENVGIPIFFIRLMLKGTKGTFSATKRGRN